MRKIEVSFVIKDLEGNPLASAKSNQEKGLILLTVGEVFVNTLLAPVARPESYEESAAKVSLAERIASAKKDIELEDKEIELLRELVPRNNNLPLIVARAVGILQEKEG